MNNRRALLFSFLDRYSALVLSIASSMVIARLLTPADIGVFSVTMVLVSFASTLRDLGAGQYLVQERDLTGDRVRATWALMLTTGGLMALIVLVAAWPVSQFYREPRMLPIMVVISISFMANPLGSMTYAWLMREMHFETLAVMRFCSGLAGASTSIALAWNDFGPISLALGNLAATAATATLGVWFRPSHFSWLPGWVEIRRVLRFGGTASSTSLMWDMANGAPELLLGRIQGMTAAGFFSRANGLTMMFQRLVLDATQAVALPLFARAAREEASIREPFMRATSYVTALGWTFLVGLAFLAPTAVYVLYGDQWGASIDLVRVLAGGLCIALPAAMCQQALMALGQVTAILRASLALVPVQVACVAVGAQYSPLGAAIGFASAQAVSVTVWLVTAQRAVGFSWRNLLETLIKSAVLAAAVSTVPMTCVMLTQRFAVHDLVQLVGVLLVAPVVLVLVARLIRHPLALEFKRLWQSTRRG